MKVETQGYKSYKACKHKLKLRIISHYRYDKSLDTIPIGETIAEVYFKFGILKSFVSFENFVHLQGSEGLQNLQA